jgi:hypothetical protein
MNYAMRATAHHHYYKAYLIISEFDLEDEPLFYEALDALFGDLATRASSDRFVFKLYEMIIN